MAHYYIDDMQAVLPAHIRRRSFQPGKKTILIAVLLSILLLMSQMFCTFNQSKPSKISMAVIHEPLESLNSLIELPPCLKSFLGNAKPPAKPQGTCHHITPPRGFCSLTQELFYKRKPEMCQPKKKIEFCHLDEEKNIKCILPSDCVDKSLFIGAFNPNGTVWKKIFFNQLESKIFSATLANDYRGYLFIKCIEDREEELEDPSTSNDVIQLFVYPKVLNSNTYHSSRKDYDFNINMIMIDSLSQNHFYRSLPSTVNLLDKLKEDSSLTVTDFQYVQSVKQRTYESLEVLFSGYVNTLVKPFGTYSSPYHPLPLNVLLEKFKKKGYKTLWIEDLCWQWEWGLVKDLKVYDKSLSKSEQWQSFEAAFRNSSIDELGVTLASCDILSYNNANDPFHNVRSVCFNGKYHHEYLLEYLQLYQDQMIKNNKPFFTFAQTNVAHEETGIRIQSLDKYLRKYLENVHNLKRTITILFSDHGSAYGEFLEASPEAYVETFNPFLIIIFPKEVRKYIGETRIKIFNDNSQNLITLLDVHETLLTLINETNQVRDITFEQKFVTKGGLFNKIPPDRRCNDLPLILPNLCICKNFETIVSVGSNHHSYAEFSLGVINNMILEQRRKDGQRGFGNCQLLMIKTVRSVKELRFTADIIQYKIDAEVVGVLDQKIEYYFFILEIGGPEPPIRLLSFERNSPYAGYRSCKDPNVDIKMCYCQGKPKSKGWNFLGKLLSLDFFLNSVLSHDRKEEQALKQIQSFYGHTPNHSSTFVDKYFPSDQPCLYVIRHQYENNSFNIFGLNLCGTLHKVTLEIVTDNVQISDKPKSSYLLRHLDLKLLLGGTNINMKSKGTWDYNIIVI
ncbi:hypothetical protein Avbf_01571 [Armadillidium vulgare]|nr:hypothetical protein Avbf_01571 [Armadillidium vulgare]